MGCWNSPHHWLDANSHHTSWGRTNTNNRSESLFKYIMDNGLDIMNRSNRLTSVKYNRKEVTDITIATIYIDNFINDWHVTEEVRCSDQWYIRFTVMVINRSVEIFAIHAEPTGSPLESTCQVVCERCQTKLITSLILKLLISSFKMLLFLLTLKIVILPWGRTTGIYPGGIKTLRRKGGTLVNKLT